MKKGKMNQRTKFSVEEEEKIIDFVKSHEILFNVRHIKFRDSGTKNRLWIKLAKQLGKEVLAVKKKWTTMRDYFIRTKIRKPTGSATAVTKRDESLMFLKNKSLLNSSSSNYASTSPIAFVDSDEFKIDDEDSNDTGNAPALNPLSTKVHNETITPDVKRIHSVISDETPRLAKKRSGPFSQEPFDVLLEFLQRKQSNPIDFLATQPPGPADNLQQFFESIASTMRTFPPLSIARIKLQIAQLVGNEEIACAERNSNSDDLSVPNRTEIDEERENKISLDRNDDTMY